MLTTTLLAALLLMAMFFLASSQTNGPFSTVNGGMPPYPPADPMGSFWRYWFFRRILD